MDVQLYQKIFYAMRFIFRGQGVPDAIIAHAAQRALETITEYFREKNQEAHTAHIR
jgi:hypothetical protein